MVTLKTNRFKIDITVRFKTVICKPAGFRIVKPKSNGTATATSGSNQVTAVNSYPNGCRHM